LAGSVQNRPQALVEADADVGGAGQALAEDGAGRIGKARAAACAPAVNPEKK
jgi:hypothetical protein